MPTIPAEGLSYEDLARLIYSQPSDVLVRAEIEALSKGKPDVAEFIGGVLSHEGKVVDFDWYGEPVLPLLERLTTS